jgi:mannose-1-phosphate guanylyltransferase/mannose-6-phosphate isomerase
MPRLNHHSGVIGAWKRSGAPWHPPQADLQGMAIPVRITMSRWWWGLPVVHPVLLCGGSGTRLWPLSRQSFPKQFAPLLGAESLFQQSARRLQGPGLAPPVVVTSDQFRFIVKEQLGAIGIDAAAALIEPDPRNTAPAILCAALWLAAKDPDALMLVAPSDHVMPDAEGFREALARALPAARAGQIVTFGIAPVRAETGYGYLELARAEDLGKGTPMPLTRFVEKPGAASAEAMLAAGNYLWNSGMFLFSAKAMIEAFVQHQPGMMAAGLQAVEQALPDLHFIRLAAKPWAELPAISIDYAIMEKASNLAVMPYGGGWSDLGSWDAVWQESGPDRDGNAVSGNALAIDCRQSLLRSESEGLELVGIGLDGIIAVAMPDAVLVARKGDAQRVKDAVEKLKARKARQATAFNRDHRPWGWFESLATGPHFQVKRIVVNPGAALSLQSHKHRSEHWVVVQGTARVTVDGEVSLLGQNESTYIPQGAIHRLENPGQDAMILIEVQTGTYLGEDDIIRYEDDYARR